MRVSGHKTRSTFDRYDITAEDDIAEAVEITAADVARQRQRERGVAPLERNAESAG